MSDARGQFDVVVIGAGPAGLAAAAMAAEAGRTVALLEQSPWLGGQIWRGEEPHPASPVAQEWIQRVRRSGAQIFTGATAVAAPGSHRLLVETPAGAREFTGRKLILATGARERFLPFPGWTLPGVLGPGGLLGLVKSGWPVAGQRVVVAGSGPVLLATAAALPAYGARVQVVMEQASRARVARFGLGLWRYPEKLRQGAALAGPLLGVPYLTGCWPVRAEGGERVERVILTDGCRSWSEECDTLACGFHLVPNLEWPRLLGCRLEKGAVWVNSAQETSVAAVYCAGEGTGIAGAEAALMQGCIAGLAAAGEEEAARRHWAARTRWRRFGTALDTAFAPRVELRGLATPDTLICRCEDVPRAALDPHSDWRDAKLHTRCGMGACQGRVCGTATEFLYGWENRSIRPPLFPVRVGALMSRDPHARTFP